MDLVGSPFATRHQYEMQGHDDQDKAESLFKKTSYMSCKVCVTILAVFSNTDYDSSFYRDKQYLFFCLFSMTGDQVDQTDHDHTRERGMRKVGGNTVIAGRQR